LIYENPRTCLSGGFCLFRWQAGPRQGVPEAGVRRTTGPGDSMEIQRTFPIFLEHRFRVFTSCFVRFCAAQAPGLNPAPSSKRLHDFDHITYTNEQIPVTRRSVRFAVCRWQSVIGFGPPSSRIRKVVRTRRIWRLDAHLVRFWDSSGVFDCDGFTATAC
jgi:hypothetical protein